MNKFFSKESSFDFVPEMTQPEAVKLGTPSTELKGNSAEGNVITGFERGNGIFAAYNRGHESYLAGGDPHGSDVTPAFPFVKGEGRGNESASSKS